MFARLIQLFSAFLFAVAPTASSPHWQVMR